MDTQVQTPTVITDIDTMKAIVAAKLDKLARWEQEQKDSEMVIDQQKVAILAPIQAQIEELMKPYKVQLEELDKQKAEFLAAHVPGITALRAEIEQDALAAGAVTEDHKFSASGDKLMVIYYNGRETWDGKGLNGYAVANPAVLKFRKVGKPYTSIQGTRCKKEEE